MERIFMCEATSEGSASTQECHLSDSLVTQAKRPCGLEIDTPSPGMDVFRGVGHARTLTFQDQGPNIEGSHAPTSDAFWVLR